MLCVDRSILYLLLLSDAWTFVLDEEEEAIVERHVFLAKHLSFTWSQCRIAGDDSFTDTIHRNSKRSEESE